MKALLRIMDIIAGILCGLALALLWAFAVWVVWTGGGR